MHKVGGLKFTPHATWVDPEGGGGQGVRTPPLKNHKATKPAFNVGPSPAHHRKAMSMVFRWQADDGPFIAVIWILYPPPPSTEFFFIKFGPPSDKTFWIPACATALHICDVKSADYCCLSFKHVICNNNS